MSDQDSAGTGLRRYFSERTGGSGPDQRGQFHVFVLLILIVLAAAGAFWLAGVTEVVHSDGSTVSERDASVYAQAGLEFANDRLTNSLDGADWRPPGQSVPPSDPDFALIDPPAGPDGFVHGFTRYGYGTGRFLIRITYDPVNSYAGSAKVGYDLSESDRYIRIESVGRTGTVDSDILTAPLSASTVPTSTITAYKQIGLTDYARFITDPGASGQVAAIGVPSVYSALSVLSTAGVDEFKGDGTSGVSPYPVALTVGAPDAFYADTGLDTVSLNPVSGMQSTREISRAALRGGGGSFRSNTSVRFYGVTRFYLDRTNATGAGPGRVEARGEAVEVAGRIFEDGNGSRSLVGNPGSHPTVEFGRAAGGAPILPSSSTFFDSYGGAVRDSGVGTNPSDISGRPRGIRRLEPPVMDGVDLLSLLPRYRALTMNSAPMFTHDGERVLIADPSQHGYGRFTYIDNYGDLQGDISGKSMPDQWTDPTESAPGWRNNDLYTPPGVDIRFGPQPVRNLPGLFTYGYCITRHDSGADSAGPVQWIDPATGAPSGTTLIVFYDDISASNDPTDVDSMTRTHRSNDVIIYAEGNVRLSGIVSADPGDPLTNAEYPARNGGSRLSEDQCPRHITIVTNGTAYIDGSLLKGNPDSSIAVLAHDYVCVNTTQFFAGKDIDFGSQGGAMEGDPGGAGPFTNAHSGPGGATAQPSLVTVGSTGSMAGMPAILQEFEFGLPPGYSPASYYGGHGKVGVYLSAAASADPGARANILTWDVGSGLQLSASPVLVRTVGALSRCTFSLAGGAGTIDSVSPSIPVEVGVELSNNSAANLSLERVAVLPNDVRIEALLFAETKSFFVIPGRWFNSSAADDIKSFSSSPDRGPSAQHNWARSAGKASDRFPFYGQPADLKITIDGAVTEAMPADVSDEAVWLLHWGWIPKWHGSLIPGNKGGAERSPHSGTVAGRNSAPAPGLTIVYDPAAGYPYDSHPTGQGHTHGYLRVDAYGNPLPFTPKLPVCPGLTYGSAEGGVSVP